MPGSQQPSPPRRRPSWRMRLVVGAIVVAIAGAAMAGWLIARTSAPPSGPVILISIGSLRADRLGAYGSRRTRTPNIDALAAAGIVFDRAYSHSPLTLPAHLAMLSGRLPFETGVRGGEGDVLPVKLPLLSTVLRRRGFKTAGIVSSALLGRQTGLAHAFDFFDDEMPQRRPSVPLSASHRDGAATIEVAKRWVDQQSNRFFLFLHLDEPRVPFAPPSQRPGEAYDGQIARADQLVGEFVAFLKERGFYDQAVIVLVADHGESLGEHGETGHGLFVYEPTVRTPLVVKMPDGEGGGRRRQDLVQHIDILPTLLDLMGAPRPSGLRGRSLTRLLDSDRAALAAPSVYAETVEPRQRFGWGELMSVTDGRYRFIRAPRPELYDLQQDRGEQHNIIASNPSAAAALNAALDRILDRIPPPTSRLSDDERQAVIAAATEAPGDVTPAGPAKDVPKPNVAKSEAAMPPAPTPLQPADPKDGLELVAKLGVADALAADGKLSAAAGAYRDVALRDAGIPAAWQGLGLALLWQGKPREALDAYSRALRIDPAHAWTVLGAARAQLMIGRLAEAERLATVAAKLQPLEANELLVLVALRKEDLRAARQAALAAAEADPASPMVAFVDGMEPFQAGRFEEALPKLEEAVQQAAARPVQTPDLRVFAAEAHGRLGHHAEAEARLVEELKWFPESVRAREALGVIYLATDRAPQVPELVNLLAVVQSPDAYAAACRLLSAAGDRKRAAALRAEGRRLFGDEALRAAEGVEPATSR